VIVEKAVALIAVEDKNECGRQLSHKESEGGGSLKRVAGVMNVGGLRLLD
jgi:hypothetical protein